MTNTTTALQALKRIAAIENKLDGGDWDEIGEARLIALEAIAALAAPAPALDAPAERDALLIEVGRAMVEMTTTVNGQDEWLCIPELWRRCMDERDMLRAEVADRASQPTPADHFAGVNKMVQQPTPAQDAAATVPADNRDAVAEALRKALNGLPRYSFLLDGLGNVRRVPERFGAWIEWQAAHELFDPVVVDSLLPATPAAHPVATVKDSLGVAANPVAGQGQAGTLPHPGSPEASAMIDSLLAEYDWPANTKNAARAGYEAARRLMAAPTAPQAPALVPLTENHKLDTDQQVFFYEQDFYVLSNFSSFALRWKGLDFPTSEHAYHWEKFNIDGAAQAECRKVFLTARSAHDAFKAAAELKQYRRADWDDVKVSIMRDILRAKAEQHEYVRRKLLATGDRELIEDSWRDDYWGWGPNRDGQNMLGKLWMEVRAEFQAGITPTTKEQQA